jgi:hypothetical protein
MREFERFWQNSLKALFFAASQRQLNIPAPSLMPSNIPYIAPNNINFPPNNSVTKLNATIKRRRRRKRNKNRRFFPFWHHLQQTPILDDNKSNVHMKLKSTVR